jgi:hypothetical protein
VPYYCAATRLVSPPESACSQSRPRSAMTTWSLGCSRRVRLPRVSGGLADVTRLEVATARQSFRRGRRLPRRRPAWLGPEGGCGGVIVRVWAGECAGSCLPSQAVVGWLSRAAGGRELCELALDRQPAAAYPPHLSQHTPRPDRSDTRGTWTPTLRTAVRRPDSVTIRTGFRLPSAGGWNRKSERPRRRNPADADARHGNTPPAAGTPPPAARICARASCAPPTSPPAAWPDLPAVGLRATPALSCRDAARGASHLTAPGPGCPQHQ